MTKTTEHRYGVKVEVPPAVSALGLRVEIENKFALLLRKDMPREVEVLKINLARMEADKRMKAR